MPNVDEYKEDLERRKQIIVRQMTHTPSLELILNEPIIEKINHNRSINTKQLTDDSYDEYVSSKDKPQLQSEAPELTDLVTDELDMEEDLNVPEFIPVSRNDLEKTEQPEFQRKKTEIVDDNSIEQ